MQVIVFRGQDPFVGGSDSVRGLRRGREMDRLLTPTLLHVVGKGGIALVEAIRPGSRALLAFGPESVIEGARPLLAVRHLHHLAGVTGRDSVFRIESPVRNFAYIVGVEEVTNVR